MSIPAAAIRRPIMMFMICAVIVLLGGISLTRLPVDLLPDISYPSVSVRVTYTGVGPLEMETLVTRPLEQALSACPSLDTINSTSAEGSSNIRLAFTWGTDLDAALADVRTRIDRVRGRLPEDADTPIVSRFDSNAMPIMSVAVEGDFNPVTLREIAEQDLSTRLERAPGVASVTVGGGLRRQIHVNLSREKVAALNMSVDRILSLLRTENQNIPIGEITQGSTTYLLRSEGEFQNLDQIRNLVLMQSQGVPVYLKDVAAVTDSTEDVRSFLRINGRPGVRMQVQKQSGTNTVEVSNAVRREVELMNQEIPGIKLSVLDDNAIYINRSIASVQEHALVGSILVVLIIFLFLQSPRSTLIVCTSIPISVFGTFALLYFAGFTLNTMTFGGLALAIGMIVDASIVVLENSYRHRERGKDRLTASVDGSEEVWSAIVASILTQIAVFVPLLFLSGISSILFRQLSVVVIFALLTSLLVAVTLVPVLCSKLLRLPPPAAERKGWTGRLSIVGERSLKTLDETYRRLLHLALSHRPTVLAVGTASVVLAVLILRTLPSELTSQTDEGQVSVTAELPVGTRIEMTDEVMSRFELMVRELVPEAQSIIASGGGGGGGPMGGGATNRGTLQILLAPKDERQRSSDQIAQALRRQLSGLAGVVVRASASGGNQMTRMMTGGYDQGRLSVEVQGHDLDQLRALAEDVSKLMSVTPGIANPRLSIDVGRPEFAIQVDRPKAALFGLTMAGVANALQTNIAGTQAALYREGGNEYPIVVRLTVEDRNEINDVNDILVSSPSNQGQVIPVKNVLVLDQQRGPMQVQRKNQERITTVSAEPEVSLSQGVDALSAGLSRIEVPKNFTVAFGAEVEQQRQSFNQLRLVLILAVLLVYAVMASQYESLRDPLVIMLSLPTAALGLTLALKLTGTSFNLQAYLGVIMLAGIVVSNGILLVDYTNVLRRRDGLPLREAVELAGRTRLRPILMTALSMMLGLVPMALGLGEGSELQVPLARVVIGGLLTSTFITLLFVPTVYTLFEEGLSGLRLRRGVGRE
jgi:hydrophobic/amphiphilic exporter-1 (mainly G- bacteria), HAE1 family